MSTWKEARGYFPGDWVRPRRSTGNWRPLVDLMEVFPGHRNIDRGGAFELYDAPIGVRLRVEEADKSDPLEFDGKIADGLGKTVRVWEQEDGSYAMLYYEGHHVAYAVSEDGYHWTRPPMGLIDKDGSKENNLVTDAGGDMLKAVFEDPTAPPEERFKGMGCEGALINSETGEVANEGEAITDEDIKQWWADQEYLGPEFEGPRLVLKGRVIGWTSPDRIHWKRSNRIIGNYPMDGGLSARYDERSGYYYAYCRINGAPQEQFELIGSGAPEDTIFHRAVGLSMTRDFDNWPAPKLLIFPDGQDNPDLSFYGGDYFPYPGGDDLHCLFLQAYHHATDQVDTQLAISRDGLLWQRPERKPIIPVGSRGGDPDTGMVYSWGSGIAKLPDGCWGSLYAGSTSLHNAPDKKRDKKVIQWARWQPHRFCGVEAEVEGRFTIPTVRCTGSQLRLNYRCRPGGYVKAEILRNIPSRVHPDVDPVPGLTFAESDLLQSDAVDEIVTWNGNGDLSAAGETVAIRLRLFQAKVFAYLV